MPTDSKRRDVARRLRGYVDMPDGWWQETLPQFYIEKCVFGDLTRHGESELFARLADFIDPSCDRDTPQKVAEEMFGKMRHSTKDEADAYEAMLKSKSVELHPVDRDALLALANDLNSSASMLLKQNDLDPSRKRRGMRRDHAKSLMAASDRIREACGEAVRNG